MSLGDDQVFPGVAPNWWLPKIGVFPGVPPSDHPFFEAFSMKFMINHDKS